MNRLVGSSGSSSRGNQLAQALAGGGNQAIGSMAIPSGPGNLAQPLAGGMGNLALPIAGGFQAGPSAPQGNNALPIFGGDFGARDIYAPTDDDDYAYGDSGSGGSGRGYDIVQPDGPNTPFNVVPDQMLPTRDRTTGNRNRNTTTTGGRGSRTDTNRDRTSTTRDTGNINRTGQSTRTGTNTRTEEGSRITDRMDERTRGAYNDLLSQLQGGGTDAMKKGKAALEALLGRSTNAEAEFTTDAARAQAQKSIPKYARELREGIMPSIYGAQEGAGLSGDALSALLGQDQLTRVSEAAAAAELGAIEAYGDLSQGQMRITRDTAGDLANDPAERALQDLMRTGISAYENETTKNITTDIINEITKFSENENRDLTSTTVDNETGSSTTEEDQWEDVTDTEQDRQDIRRDYRPAGGGRGGNPASLPGFRGQSPQSRDEDMAGLLAALGPNQNLQDMYRTGAQDAFMGGTQASGNNIQNLMRNMGIQF